MQQVQQMILHLKGALRKLKKILYFFSGVFLSGVFQWWLRFFSSALYTLMKKGQTRLSRSGNVPQTDRTKPVGKKKKSSSYKRRPKRKTR